MDGDDGDGPATDGVSRNVAGKRRKKTAEGDAARSLWHAEDVPHQEISGVIGVLVAHLDSDELALSEALLVLGGEIFVDRAKDIRGGLAVQLQHEVALASGDEHRRADGPTALGDHRGDRKIARERDAYQAAPVDSVPEKEPMGAGRHGAAGLASEHRDARGGRLDGRQCGVQVEGEGVGQQHHGAGVVAHGLCDGDRDVVRGAQQRLIEMERAHPDAGHPARHA